MLKKFNVFALTLLILGQTILGPMAVSAESITPVPDAQATSEEGANVSETTETETKTEEKTEPENESNGVGSETGQGDGGVEKKDDATDSKTEEKSIEGKEESEKKPEDKQEETPADSEEGDLAESDVMAADEEVEEDEVSTLALGTEILVDHMNIENLVIGHLVNSTKGDEATIDGDDYTIGEGKADGSYHLTFNFSLKGGHGYGKGAYYEFKVPTAFDLKNKTDPIKAADGTVVGRYEINPTSKPNGTVQIIFNENIEGSIVDGGEFTQAWALSDTLKKGDFEQSSTFDINGEKTLHFKFENTHGETINKSDGTHVKNAETVSWSIDVNTNTEDISGQELTDNMEVKAGTVVVTELHPKLNGSLEIGSVVAEGNGFTLTNNTFPIKFSANNNKAYRITYNTVVTPEQREAALTGNPIIKNKAELKGKKSEKIAELRFDKPITKTNNGYSNGNGRIQWKITVNKDGNNIENGLKIKDTISFL